MHGKTVLKIKLFLFFVYFASQSKDSQQIEVNLGSCINEIVTKFYPKIDYITIISAMNRNGGVIRHIMERAEFTVIVEKYPSANLNSELLKTFSLPRIYHMIILIKRAYTLHEVLSKMSQYKYAFDGKFLIAITDINPDVLATVRELKDICWRFRIINVNFITHNSKSGIDVYSYNPFLGETIYPTGECNSSMAYLKYNMFSSKTKNFHGHPFLIASLNYTFFMNLKPVNTKKRYTMSGMEGDILSLICEKLNLTCIVAYTQPNETRNVRYQNGSYTWGLGSLERRDVDCSIGYNELITLAIDSFEFTRSHYIAALSWVVSARDLVSSWARLYLSIRGEVWLILIIFISIGCAIITVVKYLPGPYYDLVFGEGNNYPLFHLYAALLGHPIPIWPTFITRYMALVWILTTFIFRMSYQGASVKFLIGDTKEPIPHSEEEMVAQGYKYVIHDSYKQVFESKNRLIQPAYVNRSIDIFKMLLSSKHKYVSYRFKDIIQFYNQQHSREGFLETTMGDVEYSSLVMYFAPGSFFRKEIDRQIKYIRQSGMIQKLRNAYIRPYSWSCNKYSAPARALQRKEVRVGFEVLIYGNIAALAIFITEHLYKYFIRN